MLWLVRLVMAFWLVLIVAMGITLRGMSQRENEELLVYIERSFGNDLYLVDLRMDQRINLGFVPPTDCKPAWSPDRNRAVFSSQEMMLYDMRQFDQTMTFPLAPHANFCDMAWSPDQQYIAYTTFAASKDTNIYLLNMITGEGELILARDDYRDSHPVWLPDSSGILFISAFEQDEDEQLHMLQLASRDIVPVNEQPGDYTDPEWSHDGRSIVYGFGDGEQFTIMKQEGLNGEPVPMHTPDHSVQMLAWSPDDQQIVFTLNNRDDSIWNMHLLDVASGDVRQLTDLPQWDMAFFPVWSADGQRILYQSFRGIQGWDVYLLDPNTGHEEPITDNYNMNRFPAWVNVGK